MFQREPGFKALRPKDYAGASLRQRRTWYAEGEAEPPPPATETQPAKKGSSGQEGSEAKFTQADLDQFLGNARKQARDSVMSDLLKELGLDSADSSRR